MVDSGEKFGKYTLVERLASGGMAEIFKARAAGVGGFEKIVAIKRLHRQYTEESQFATMLADEAQLAVQLNHPNIGEVFDLGEIDGQYFIVMEYIEGLDLEQLAERTELAEGLVVDVAARTADALHHAHTRDGPDGKPLDLVHRDVSPQNVMIGVDGAVKLVDFGVAKARMRAQETKAGVIKGKLSYMSPEQTRGAPLDGRADVYGLGMVMYELLAGRHPFEGLAGEELYNRARTSDFAALDELRPDLPAELVEVVERALERDRSRRFEDADQMKRALEEVAASLGSFGRSERAEMVRRHIGVDAPKGRQPRSANPESMTSDEYMPDHNSVIFDDEDSDGRRGSGDGDTQREPTARLRQRVWTGIVRRFRSVAQGRPAVVAGVAAATGLVVGVVVWWAVLAPADDESGQVADDPAVTVSTIPSGAEVSVDGRNRGETPVELQELDEERVYTVELTREGYRDESLEMRVGPDSPRRVVRLEPRWGTVDVETTPEEIEVAIPGVVDGEGPVTWTGLDMARSDRIEARPPEGDPEIRSLAWEEADEGRLDVEFEFEKLDEDDEDEEEETHEDDDPARGGGAGTAARRQPEPTVARGPSGTGTGEGTEEDQTGDQELDIWELGGDGREGRLNVRTRADGGRIYVDGDMVKDGADLVGHSLEAGSYEVEFHPPEEASEPEVRTVEIEAGETSTIRFSR